MKKTVSLLLALALSIPCMMAGQAEAQTYPDRPVRLIVPFPPGGATDVNARILAAELTALLKQPFVIDNRPGASGTIGIDLVAKAPPDGYTLGVSGVGPTAILPIIDPKLPYNPARDLEIVAGLGRIDFVLVARPGLPVANLPELVAYAKANPGKVTYATAGVAGPQQLQIEHLSLLAGMKLFLVPFPGDSQATAAVVAGDVDIALMGIATGIGLVKAGKVKALAMAGSERSPTLPEVATAAEQTGFTEFTGYTWNLLVAPKGTPAAVIARLNEAIAEAAGKPEVQAKLEALGIRPLGGSAAAVTEFVARETEKNRRVIEVTGIRRE
ncbi:tripartite tricarboxylate transporter substrate binding protein [Reyranella aquatilis]|uniref:Tripartite tricarboxylate transporter substrate binding protein n=1 Tax=Reyranella aquatilis TaxID=2035356 RepID=A0ABS8KX86_9HYPH|nr:tripartite tricarboxylate transporter substrate binding protein [Reyranella aquatilis]MCC8430671.1 tripartite tricarboxylate transporter substrate binding protein [Reyranella aquatilis]